MRRNGVEKMRSRGILKQGSMPRHSGMNVTAFILAETPMPQHSLPNAAAFKQELEI